MAYVEIFVKTIRSQAFYLTELLITNFEIIVQGAVGILFGLFLHQTNPQMTLEQLFSYYLFGIGFINIFQRSRIIYTVEDDMEMGNISTFMAKPIDFIYQYLVRDIAEQLSKAWLYLLATLAVINILFGWYVPPIEYLLRAILILPITIAFIYIHTGIFIIAVLRYEKMSKLTRIYGMTSFFVGGGLASIAYFPDIVSYMPFQYYFYAPLTFITKGVFPNPLLFVFYFVVLIGIFLLLKSYIYRRLEVNGG